MGGKRRAVRHVPRELYGARVRDRIPVVQPHVDEPVQFDHNAAHVVTAELAVALPCEDKVGLSCKMQYNPMKLLCPPKGEDTCKGCLLAVMVFARFGGRLQGEDIPTGCALAIQRKDDLVRLAQLKLLEAATETLVTGAPMPKMIDML
jgi:hypothetical protein